MTSEKPKRKKKVRKEKVSHGSDALDDEIRKFEDLLKIESVHCSKTIKAKPYISQEWLDCLHK